MLFHSWQYAVFLPVVFFLHWRLPHRLRWGLLLVSSYLFYMSWNAKYVALILLTTAVTFFCAGKIERTTSQGLKKALLYVSLAVCLGILFVFKYAPLHLVLPIGISFYTFQMLGYVIDVYRGDLKAERHFGEYATFISFFPQLIAGPIERAGDLLPQMKRERFFSQEQALHGTKLIVWGLYKKMAIADNLTPYVDRIFDDVYSYSGFAFLLAAFFFSVQLYCDFSAYSDIARGSAKLLGIELRENFETPYFSKSVKEFWRRWHVTLGAWMRDYVFYPLLRSRPMQRMSAALRGRIGKKRAGKLTTWTAMLVLWFLVGVWHGGTFNYIVGVGLLQWVYIVTGELLQPLAGSLGKRIHLPAAVADGFRTVRTFALITIGFACFRANHISDVFYMLRNLGGDGGTPVYWLWKGFSDINMYKEELLLCCVLFFLPLFVLDVCSARKGRHGIAVLEESPKAVQWAFFLLVGLVTVFLSPKGMPENFVYFQF